ncbi:TonB-dependent receptor plug domain protein [Ostertagia ostertagi]
MPYPYLSKYLVLLLIIAGCSFTAAAQQYTVTGKVIAATDQLPVPGTVVRVADSSRNATATDPSGKFRILVHKGQKIIVSYLGYEEQSFVINDNQELNITLVSKVNKVDEVVVIGYGAVKKSHLTGAVSKVTNDNLDQIPVSRVDDALMGKLAGVSVQKTDAQAGAEPTIQIRGATSITAGTSPLIVIDGYPVPTDLSAIDMSDVESIEVLKDAASAAMYGSRGGNGVLLVTTKSGRANRQRIGINLASGMKQVYRKLPRTSLGDWKNYVAAQNNGEIPAQISLAEQYDANSDIQDAIFRTSNYTNAGVNANGGNSTVRYYVGGTFMRDDGVMKGNDYRRYGGKVGLDANLNKKLKADAQEAVRNAPSWLPLYHTEQTAAATGKPVGSYASQRDFDPNRNPAFQGISLSASTSNSTLAMIDGISDKRTNIRNILNSYIQYNFNPYLYFKATAGYTGSHNERNYFQKSWARADAILDGEAYARTTSSAIFSQTKLTDLLNEDMLFYKRSFGKHDVDAIVGFSIQKTSWDNITGNPYPKVNWGFTTNIGYKNFDLSITLQGSHGAKIFNIDPYYYETQYGTTGATAYQNYPLEMQQSVRLKTETNLEIQDASFVALRNVNLGYSFSGKAAKKIGMTGLRCYLSAANLLYLFADNYTSLNPEANNTYTNDPLRKGYQRGAIPIARTITFGINTNF